MPKLIPFPQPGERMDFVRRGVPLRVRILDAYIDAVTWDGALGRISAWASRLESRYVCACNVHSVVTATLDPAFRAAINGADMSVPDGMPLVWVLSRLGFRQQRIYGPDLMWRVCETAAAAGQRVFFYGSSPQVISALKENLERRMPSLMIAGTMSPPYRQATVQEDQHTVDAINASGASIVLVGLGCPKQEIWMAEHRGRIRAVMIGVGVGFDQVAGTKKRSPTWMQNHGLEWLYRLMQEPRRLWRRYLVTNTIFVVRIARAMLKINQSDNFPVKLRE